MKRNWHPISCDNKLLWHLMAGGTHRAKPTTVASSRQAPGKTAGFSYTEVLVATFLIAILLVPALESLQSGIQGSDIHATQVDNHHRLAGKLEEVLAEPFNELELAADTAGGSAVIVAAYSDDVGTNWRRLVYLARYDGDNADSDNDPFTGADQGILWVRVQIQGSDEVLETLSIQ